MAAFNKFNDFVNQLAIGTHNLHSNTLKIMLTDTAPVATNTVKANITDITAANGYSAGGATATLVSDGQTSGTYKLVLSQPTFTAAGGSIAQFRYAVLYNFTSASGNLIGWWDNGAEVNITNGNSFQVQTDQTNGVLQLV
jgi:hypothetical protein